MYPQSELDNYKLQVDLLQEKLQRSEENRNQLEHKLEQILQKRSEHDKSVRSKTRQKYQQFLDEQQKRNERNKLLVQMLERIDEQTSAMSARSERLKMMKLQYEMYFAKLVQAQTMRCIQNNAMAATTIPVILQAPAAAAATSTPLKSTEQTTATLTPAPVSAATTYQIDSNLLPTTYSSGNLYQLSNFNETLSTPRHWTLALATPAPTNMYTMSATPPTAAAAARAPTLQDLDYLKYPIGYLPPSMQFAYHQQQQHPNTADMLSTNCFNYNKNIVDDDRRHAATFDEIADINDLITSKQTPHQSRMTTATKAYEKISRNDDNNNNNNNNNESSHHAAEPFEAMKRCESTISRRAAAAVPAAMLSTTITAPTGTPTPTSTPIATSISTSLPSLTTTSTALTFDKLSTHNGKSKTLWQSTDEHEAERGAATTTLPAAAGAKLPKAAEFLSYNKSAAAQPNRSDFVNANSSNAPSNNNNTHNNNTNNNNNNNGGKYYDTEKLAAVNRDTDDADDANLMRRHKIDEAWPTTTTSPAPTTTTFIGKDNDNASNALPAGDKRFESKNNRNSFDTELTLPPAKTTDTNTYQPPQFARKEKMSIENIENTFYGELVKPVAADEVLATTESNKQAALTATNGLLEELTSGGSETIRDSNPAEEHVKAQDEPQQADYVYDSQSVAEPLTNYAPDSQSNFAESAEAGYAATLGDNEGGIIPTENYTTEAEAQQYQQYDATLAAGQDYDPNLDYQNYDAAAYQAAYDPNAYPGYTYDETTGQYTANDENQQYAEQAVAYGEAAYMQQDYSEATMQQEQQQEGLAGNYEDYSQYQQQQQQQDELTSMAAAQATADEYNIPATPETAALLPQATASKVDQPNTEPLSTPSASAPTPTEPVAATSLAPIKPILSTEKSAANDAQQKRKKRVNFVDSSETDESSSVKPDGAAAAAGAASGDGGVAGSSESDFDFSSSGGATNN